MMNIKVMAILSAILMWLMPIVPLLILVGGFIMFDTFFGIWAAKKNGILITSRRFSRIVSKMISYTATIILVYGMDKYIIDYWVGDMIITKLAAGVLCFVEGFSIDEKIRAINDNKGVAYFLDKIFKFVKEGKDKIADILSK